MVTAPVRVPEAVGLKTALIVQLPPAGIELPADGQFPVPPKAKSPLIIIPAVIVRAEPPVLLSMAVPMALVVPTGVLGNGSGLGEIVTEEPELAPVPVRLMVWGLFEALSVRVTVPVRVPVAVGLKVTLMVQLPAAATELPQLSVSAKSPLTAMLLMARLTVPPLVRVATLAVLVVPTA